MEIGWNNNPANGMKNGGGSDLASILAMSGGATAQTATSPNAPGTGSAPAGTVPGQPPPTATAPDPTKLYAPVQSNDPRFIHADQHWSPQARAAYEAAVNAGPAGHEAAAAIGAAAWQQYDKNRQGYALSEAEGRLRWLASKNAASTAGTAVNAPVYDPDTDTFSYVDKDGKWTHGVGAKDIYKNLNADVQKQYPEWYFGQYATQQEQAKRTNLDAAAYTNQSFAKMGQQSTRYAATGL